MPDAVQIDSDGDSIIACTVARDVQNFDLLIDDMESLLGDRWGDLGFDDVESFLSQPDAADVEFVTIAFDDQDSERSAQIESLIKMLAGKKIKTILIAEDTSPVLLHRLLRAGAHEFVPYPLPKGELAEAIERIRAPEPETEVVTSSEMGAKPSTFGGPNRHGDVFAVHGLAGGIGATTFAVNLASEFAALDKQETTKVCLLDLDLQFGSCATYLDLPRNDTIYEILSDIPSMDSESFMQALQTVGDSLYVFTAPHELLPLDLVSNEDIERMIDMAARHFDFVIIDMPSTLVSWTEVVMEKCDLYFAVMQLDLRSAQNAMRMIRGLKAENLPLEKMRYVLNKAPGFADLTGKSRVKRLAENLEVDFEVQLTDGGKQVSDMCDNGMPLIEGAAKNNLRKDILKLAQKMFQVRQQALEPG